MTDLRLYAACERQKIVGEPRDAEGGRRAIDVVYRYVRLHEEPMRSEDVLPWLIEHGYVKRLPFVCTDPDCEHEHCEDTRLVGWGTTYFGIPWKGSVER